MSKWAFFNDGFLAEATTVLHFRDLSIQRGYGVFDFFKVRKGFPVFLDEHLDRFYFSAEQMRLPVAYSKEELKHIVFELLQKNEVADTGVRITLTGGYSPDGYQTAKPNLIITLQPFIPPSGEQFEKGIKLISYEHQRQLPHVKSIDYLMAIWLQPLIKQKNADDVLYHQRGIVTECPRSNIFILTQQNKLVTPSENILKGVIRNKIIAEAKKTFEVEESPVSLQELKSAKEVFITSTTKILLPVSQIDEQVFGTAKPVAKWLWNCVHSLVVEDSKQAVK